jgi:UDP-3-O-[3-hydroxymyristoyl] glucosamine N-acyltransferase
MEAVIPHWTLSELASLLHGTLEGPGETVVVRPVEAGSSDPEGVTFAEGPQFFEKVRGSGVGAVLLGRDAPDLGVPTIRVESPRKAFGMLLHMSQKALPLNEGVHPTAVVASSATIDPTAWIGPFSVIQEGANIGPGVKIYPYVFVGENSTIGAHSIVFPSAVILAEVTLGARCIIHSGVVLGADGFGFAWDGAGHQKIPQVGRVTIGDQVEIGANSTIDRATAGSTRVGEGTKIDNLVQVGHNVNLGKHSVIAALVGVGGSSEIGSGFVAGGQAGIKDHARITDGVALAGRTGVTADILEPGQYWGTPAQPILDELKMQAQVRRLAKLVERVKKLEEEIKELKREI